MGVLAELGRLAIGAWSPGGVGGGYIASGTYAGAVDTSFNGSSSLELIAVDIVHEKLSVTSEVPLHDKFTSIDWSIPSRSHPAGLIAGGLSDGTVRVWDAAKLIRSKPSDDANRAVLFGGPSAAKKHSGPVRGLAFNTFVPTRLASGSADGTVLFWELGNPSAGASVRHPAGQPPAGAAAPKEEVTSVLWNRKVQHILASGTSSGVVNVWDLNQSRQVISIRNPRGRLRCSSLAWHPEIATQIVMTCDQDDSTGALLWDLRHPSQPIMTFTHHSSHGIASSSWCTHDSDLLLTSSRDSRTVVVSVSSGEIVSEAPQTANWNFDVKWSSRIPGVYLSSSFDGRLTVNSMMTSTTAPSVSSETASALAESFGEAAGGFQAAVPDRSPRASATQRVAYNFAKPPKWFLKPVSISLAFGGCQVSLSSKNKTSTTTVESYQEPIPLPREECDQLDGVLMDLTSDDPSPAREWCEKASSAAETPKDKMAWDALSLMFQTDSRRKLISYLGFDLPPMDAGDDITTHVYGLMQSQPLSVPVRPVPPEVPEYQQNKVDHHEEEIATITNGASAMTLTGPAPWEISENPVDNVNIKSSILDGDDTMGDESTLFKANGDADGKGKANGDHISFAGNTKEEMDLLIKRAVIVGDFKTAVDACLHVGRTADALVIAHAGGPDLWLHTQAEYLSRASLSTGSKIVGAVAGSKAKMDEYIRESAEEGKDAWKEALAVLLTYSPAEELSEACTALGQRLLSKKHDAPALFCFICGGNTRMATSAWMRDPLPRSKSTSMMIADRNERLMLLVQKVRLLTAAAMLAQGEREIGSVRSLDEVSGSVLCEYGALLAIQSEYSSAITYLSSIDPGHGCIYGTAADLHSKASDCLAVEDSMSMMSQQVTDPYMQPYETQGGAYGSQYTATSSPYMQQPSSVYPGTQMQPQNTWSSRPPLPSAVAPPPVTGAGGIGAQSFSSPPPPVPTTPTGAIRPQGMYTTQSTSGERSSFDPSTAYNEAPAYNPASYQMNTPPAVRSPLPPDTANSQTAPIGQYMQPMAPAPPQVPMPPMPGVVPPPQSLGQGLPAPQAYGANPTLDPTAALPPPPPPPPVTDGATPPPMSYHSNAKRGSGQSLPPSAEVAVSETRRSKPLSSSGTPAGPPRRSGSTSSSLSALGIGTVFLEKADVSKIPPTQQVIVKSLRGSYMYARSLSEAPMYKKKMDDVSKKLGRLLAALNNGLIDAPVVELLVTLSKSVEKGNYDEAKVVVSTLSKKYWDANSHWIQGLKRLIDCVLTGR
ncbi:transport protein SEC31 [Gracilaria domingensis]|nr:transport protein SEC31 [Gracilaria domingensis]